MYSKKQVNPGTDRQTNLSHPKRNNTRKTLGYFYTRVIGKQDTPGDNQELIRVTMVTNKAGKTREAEIGQTEQKTLQNKSPTKDGKRDFHSGLPLRKKMHAPIMVRTHVCCSTTQECW